jgi:hypothetical protein
MANTYSWSIKKLDVYPSSEGLDNVVFGIHWGLVATSDQTYSENGEDVNYTDEIIGLHTVNPPDSSNFTAFDSLSASDVEGWLEAGMDYEALKAQLDLNIENLISPPVVTKEVPW